MKRRRIVLAAAAVVITTSDALEGAMAMKPTNKLLDKIDEIADGHAVGSARIQKQLGVALAPDAEQSDEYTLIYTGSAGNGTMFDTVELRVQGPAASKPRQMVLLAINPSVCVTLAEVKERYGVEGDLSISPPRPTDDPVYLVYLKSWGKVSFGFGRDFSCLREVVIDIQAPNR
jgi:hypothetical protein